MYGDDSDPLAGAVPGTYGTGQYDPGQYGSDQYDPGQYDPGQYDPGQYDVGYDPAGQCNTTQWGAGAPPATPYSVYDAYSTYDGTTYETGGYDSTAVWGGGIPAQGGPAPAGTVDTSGQWDATGWTGDPYGSTQWDPSGHPAGDESSYDSSPAAGPEHTAVFEALDDQDDTGVEAADIEDDIETAVDEGGVAAIPVQRRAGNRNRRRTTARRSAMLTVAVPSVAVMGVAGIAAASVSGVDTDKDDARPTQAALDPAAVKPSVANSKLDTQLASLTADADDFADRASRTQERIDLQQRQLEERKRREAEAARKEALRPKFALPVAQRGLSAYYGQAGINWMSVHSGIDFPVGYGTPVMAATDGTVSTKWNGAYGNMAIVTAPDGTETWYCHLSSTKIRYGSVKAGDVIAYSGNSGNSTGPHLHFEVHPFGGSAIDPLSWFRNHGLEPT
jgi:murein DD-endopeptidase MepM/ murein hydrolase activator NlpD